jgi:hypothetical protein
MHPSWCASACWFTVAFMHMLPSNQEKGLLVKAENNRVSHYILRGYLFPLFICRLFPQQHCPLDNTTWPLQRKGMKCDFVMLEKKNFSPSIKPTPDWLLVLMSSLKMIVFNSTL